MKKSKNIFGFVSWREFLALGIFGGAVLLALGAFLIWPTPASAASGKGAQKGAKIISVSDYHHDVSPALRDLPPSVASDADDEYEGNLNPKLPNHHIDRPDGTVQKGFALSTLAPSIPSTILNFDGIPFPGVGCSCSPPDTNGVIGSSQYVQMVNEGFQVFNKTTGGSVMAPTSIVSLWSGFGGVCQTNGDGDPVVLYDHLANRWVITQFAGTSIPTDECIAVSTTSDATGTYNRYAFHLGSNFFDYPHLSVWPDAYYMSMNVFNSSGSAFLGPQPFAFNRAAMIAGTTATFVTPGITGGANEDSYLPADLDGSILPPAGSPNSFIEFPGGGTYKTFHFHVDFATPANTTFTLFASPAAAGFTSLCPTTRGCVPQPSTTVKLDGIGDRLMFRLAYRKFSDGHESVVGNYSVSSGGVAGVRWFELRNVTSGPMTVFQESTYQPDTTWRWMGSAAMDADGNMALGFSASSSSVSPSVRYAGRLATDPPNVLTQGEATLIAGGGSQTSSGNRWGDYSAMTVDPVDDHTFWYTNEYYTATASVNWKTRIGNFKFPAQAPTPQLVSVVSRLNHTGVGNFDVAMPLTGTTGVEDRQASIYNIVFTFDQPVTSGTVAVTSGTGSPGAISFSGNTLTVPLTGITDPEILGLTVTSVNGQSTSASVSLGFLVGDANADRFTNGGDTVQVRGLSGANVDVTNFRADVNLDGFINAGDATIVRSKAGNSLP